MNVVSWGFPWGECSRTQNWTLGEYLRSQPTLGCTDEPYGPSMTLASSLSEALHL